MALAAIQAQQERIAKLEAERIERDARINQIQRQNEQLKSQQSDRDAQIAALSARLDEVDELRTQLAALKAELRPALAMD